MKGERSRGSALQALSDIARNGELEEVKQALAGSNLMEQAEGILSDRSEEVRCSVASEAAIKHLKTRHPAARLPGAAGTGNSF